MITETKSTKYITNDVQVWTRYAKEIADNGEGGDQAITLHIAPEFQGDNQYLYLETNGDPVMIGWLVDDEVEYADDVDVWVESEPWVKQAIESEF